MPERTRTFIGSFLSVLEEKNGNVSLADLSSEINRNRSHLSRVFKNVHGKSFRKARSDIRVQSILKFVKSSDLSCKRIASRVGIHPDYLCALFKRSTGITVTEFRRKIRRARKNPSD